MRFTMKRLLASIHDVTPRYERQVDMLLERLEPSVGLRLAMLVVPCHWGDAPLTPAFIRRLRIWSDAGIEMFVHGLVHRDDRAHTGLTAFKAKRMTAGEGEFVGLDRALALSRMMSGRTIVESAIGRAAAGFIAPAWLYSDGARQALVDADFALAEDHVRVWRPGGATVARGPVITWASRSRTRALSSLAAASVLRHALKPLPCVRVAVHPGDVTRPDLLRSIDETLRTLSRIHRPSAYADLLSPPRPARSS